ncbi:MAG TPA: acyl dehydratase [Methylomirabilota bacterium]|jgi:hydroxyacyl-ACP dehydratase HTD2-like protein with hotdog domain|nr:acyl dehydratase [Methylomirabilota bacterium]
MAEGQVYFEDVEPGMALPPLHKTPSNTLLFLYSAITWNPQRIHYDKDYTLTEGYKDVIVHGPLRGAFLSQLVTRWIGDEGMLKKLSYANRDVAYVNEPLICKGTVTRTWIEDGRGYVECEIWVENGQGAKLTPGNATVILPRRAT